MSLLNKLLRAETLISSLNSSCKISPTRFIAFSFVRSSENSEGKDASKGEDVVGETLEIANKQISVETSIRYMISDAYKKTYGTDPVWKSYRRNHKGAFAPRKTRETCIRGGKICGNPCPICRDEYLLFDHRNVKLLQQFINEYNGDILSYSKTGICQMRHKQLLIAIIKAKEFGTITFDVPIRQYNYSDWISANN